MSPAVRVTRHGLWIAPGRGDAAEPLDVRFDGRRVWSLRPSDHVSGRVRARYVRWPLSLRQRLDGYSTVEVVASRDGGLVARPVTVRWGPRPLRLTDDEGRHLSLDKWGRLVAAFDARSAEDRQELAEHVRGVIEDVEMILGRPAFMVSGTLLGAVRQGSVLPHDDDGDVGYLSAHSDPVDVVREQISLKRSLESRGYSVLRHSFAHLQVTFESRRRLDHYVDVFTCFYVGETFHQPFHVRGQVPHSSLLPRDELRLEHLHLPAPADPDPLLTANYGAGWRIPDPAFRLVTPDATKRRFAGWFGELLGSQEYWEDRYRDELGSRRTFAPGHPGISEFVTGFDEVVDLGCGSGSDVASASSHGQRSVGIDFSTTAIRSNQQLAQDTRIDTVFWHGNIADASDVLALSAALKKRRDGSRALVSRDVIDEIHPLSLESVIDLAILSMIPGDRWLLQWRCRVESAYRGRISVSSEMVQRRIELRGLDVNAVLKIRDPDGRERWHLEIAR